MILNEKKRLKITLHWKEYQILKNLKNGPKNFWIFIMHVLHFILKTDGQQNSRHSYSAFLADLGLWRLLERRGSQAQSLNLHGRADADGFV